jgi:hypothetical protein
VNPHVSEFSVSISRYRGVVLVIAVTAKWTILGGTADRCNLRGDFGTQVVGPVVRCAAHNTDNTVHISSVAERYCVTTTMHQFSCDEVPDSALSWSLEDPAPLTSMR